MAEPNKSVRLDSELAASARATAERTGRSLSEQISHWARVGLELKRSPGVTETSVQAALDGAGDYDALNTSEQVLVRAGWAERIDKTRSDLRLDRLLVELGREVVELDANGAVVVRSPDGVKPTRTRR